MIQSIQSYNYNCLINRQKGQWLETTVDGKLYTIEGCLSKAWFIIRNFFSMNAVSRKTALAINDICKNMIENICHQSHEPLTAKIVKDHRNELEILTKSLRKISRSLYDRELYKKIKHLVTKPEIVEAKIALEKGIKPIAIAEGVSGSYILHNRLKKPWIVFKPSEEEPGAPGNPKGFHNIKEFLDRLKIDPGTSYQKEYSAYLLDPNGFSGVPKTMIAKLSRIHFNNMRGTFKGSFQMFVPNCKPAWDHYQILPKMFSSAEGHLIPDHEIHKIAILDVRMLNCDRHLKNFIVDERWKIHPIDHGYTLPGNASNLRFDWMNFNQSKIPFSIEELNYIEQLDIKKECILLKSKTQISQEALLRFRLAGLLLKKAAEKGLTPYQIGEFMIGKHQSSLLHLVNQFFPIPSSKPSYFETHLCRHLLKSPSEIEFQLVYEIDNYLSNPSQTPFKSFLSSFF